MVTGCKDLPKRTRTDRTGPKRTATDRNMSSMSRKAYWDYVEDLNTPKDEHSLEEKLSFSKIFHTFMKHKKTDSTGIKTMKKMAPLSQTRE